MYPSDKLPTEDEAVLYDRNDDAGVVAIEGHRSDRPDRLAPSVASIYYREPSITRSYSPLQS